MQQKLKIQKEYVCRTKQKQKKKQKQNDKTDKFILTVEHLSLTTVNINQTPVSLLWSTCQMLFNKF